MTYPYIRRTKFSPAFTKNPIKTLGKKSGNDVLFEDVGLSIDIYLAINDKYLSVTGIHIASKSSLVCAYEFFKNT